MIFIERVLALVEQKGISKNKMLTDLNLNKNAFVDWSKKNQIPNGETLIKIAQYFDVSVDYLLCLTDNPNPINKRAPAVLERAEALKVAATNILGHEPTENDLEKFKELVEVFFKKFDEKAK